MLSLDHDLMALERCGSDALAQMFDLAVDELDREDAHEPVLEGYRLIAPLGRGGMGEVWRAEQLGTAREVAVKLLRDRGRSTRGRELFEQEVRLAARIEHPGIARIYDSGLHRFDLFFAMELVDGQSIDAFCRDRGLSQRRIAELMAEVCRAIGAAHRLGVVHRDLKPGNILVDRDGRPRVLDFGLASLVAAESRAAGTVAYMAPEQAGGGAVSPAMDVFALGLIFHELLTGSTPRRLPEDRRQAVAAVAGERSLEPSAAVTCRSLRAILGRCLRCDAASRYATADDLAEDLERWLRGEVVAALPHQRWERARWLARRHARVTVAVAAVVLLVASVAGASWWSLRAADARLRVVGTAAATAEYRQQVRTALTAFANGRITETRAALEATDPAARDWEWRYLAAASGLGPVGEPGANLLAVAILPSRDVVSIDMAGGVWLHEPEGGRAKAHQLEGSSVSAAAFVDQGRRVLVAADGGVRLVELADETAVLWSLESGREPIGYLHVDPTAARAAGVTAGGRLVLFDLATGTMVDPLPVPDRVWGAAWSEDGEELFILAGLQLLVWRAEGMEVLADVDPDLDAEIVAADDRVYLLTSDRIETVGLAGPLGSAALPAEARGICRAARVEGGKRLAFATGAGVIGLLDPATARLVGRLPSVDPGVSACVAQDGMIAVAAGGRVHVMPEEEAIYTVAPRIVQSGLTPDDLLVADDPVRSQSLVVRDDRAVLLRSGTAIPLAGLEGQLTSASFSPDGQQVAVATTNLDEAGVFETAGGMRTARFEGFGPLAWSPRGHELAYQLPGRRLVCRILGTPSEPERVGVLDEHPSGMSLAFSPDGGRIAAASGGRVIVWDRRRGVRLYETPKIVPGSIGCLAWSPGGSRVVVGEQEVALLDARDGTVLLRLETRREPVDALAFAVDESLVATTPASVFTWRGR